MFNNCQMQKVASMRCDCVSVCMCFSSVSTSVEDRRTHQSGDLRFHFPHPKFTSKRAKRRMVDEEEQQQLEAHDTEKRVSIHQRGVLIKAPVADGGSVATPRRGFRARVEGGYGGGARKYSSRCSRVIDLQRDQT